MTTSSSSSASTPTPFTFPLTYSFPPFWTPQPNLSTRRAQLEKWSSLILAYCRHHRLFRLNLTEALQTPLFHNREIRKRLTLAEARDVVDWMCGEEGGGRAEWVGGGKPLLGARDGGKEGLLGGRDGRDGGKEVAYIWWKGVEEWAELVAGWVEGTGQKGVVLTLYEITEGEGTVGQEFHGIDPGVLQRALAVLVKRGKAQVFGGEGGEGVKFF